MSTKPGTVAEYNESLASGDRTICKLLLEQINLGLPGAENKVWHGHPAWFLASILNKIS